MTRKKPSEKLATRRVQYIDKTVYGRALVHAELMSSGTWRITFTYPATGVDSLTEQFKANISEPLDCVRKLQVYIAENWEEFNSRVAALRKVRYAQRSLRFKERDQ